jgi:hypothetical protein
MEGEPCIVAFTNLLFYTRCTLFIKRFNPIWFPKHLTELNIKVSEMCR